MAAFVRECNLWLQFYEIGIVPLLKVVTIQNQVLALMPRYSGSLRELLIVGKVSPQHLLQSLLQPVTALSTLHHRQGVVHQDIKPENLLYDHHDGHLVLSLSDWGIANVQAAVLHSQESPLSQFAVATMGGFGTLPYMAPERFSSYISNIHADIFSLGMVMIEILTGHLPYSPKPPIADQLLNGQYYYNAQTALITAPRDASRLLLSMIHPLESRRPHDYRPILSFLRKV
jgi:serine/threonine-protein kinase